MTSRRRTRRTMRARFRLMLLPSLLVVAALLAGCGAPGEERSAETQARSQVETDISKKGPVTLTVAAYAQEDKTLQKVTKRFEQEYPNVTVNLVAPKGFSDYYATLKLDLSRPDPPDVALGGQGWTGDGQLIEAGLIEPLDAYADAYGWADEFGDLSELYFTDDGKTWGKGSLYGLSHWAASVGYFYNRAKLKKLGLDVPTSFEEFEAALENAKQSGEAPIQFGNIDKWPGTAVYAGVQNFFADPKTVNEWTYGLGNRSFNTPENLEAATVLQEWAKNGYFAAGFNGVSYDDSTAKFGAGEGVFMYTGTWMTGAWEGKDIGFINLPGGDHPVGIGSLGEPWHILSKSTNKDVAAAYIDFVCGAEMAPEWVKNGWIPAAQTAEIQPSGDLFTEGLQAWSDLNQKGEIVKYPEWATTTMGEAMGGGVQLLMAGKITPEQFVARVQEAYEKFHQTR